MKYDIEAKDELIAHALGKKPIAPAKTVTPAPAPTPAPTPVYKSAPVPAPVAKTAPAKPIPVAQQKSVRDSMPVHYKHKMLKPHEDDERYRRHIAAEREHGLDHYIASVMHPEEEYEVTGYVHDSHYHHLKDFY